jgi:hypothetical protein
MSSDSVGDSALVNRFRAHGTDYQMEESSARDVPHGTVSRNASDDPTKEVKAKDPMVQAGAHRRHSELAVDVRQPVLDWIRAAQPAAGVGTRDSKQLRSPPVPNSEGNFDSPIMVHEETSARQGMRRPGFDLGNAPLEYMNNNVGHDVMRTRSTHQQERLDYLETKKISFRNRTNELRRR